MKREGILKAGLRAVGARHRHYGSPRANFEAIGRRWSAHIKNEFGLDVVFSAASVALMMVDVKLARLEHDPNHADSWIDIGGYGACGGEAATDRGRK